jgi:hypothetical protein
MRVNFEKRVLVGFLAVLADGWGSPVDRLRLCAAAFPIFQSGPIFSVNGGVSFLAFHLTTIVWAIRGRELQLIDIIRDGVCGGV